MEKPSSISRISYVILPSEPSVVTAKTEEISVVSVAAVFKSPPTPESVSSAVVPSQVSEVDILVVPLEERIEEVSVNSSPNQVSEFSYIAKPLEVSEVSAFGGVQIPDQISDINVQSSPIQPRDFSAIESQIWNLSKVSVRVFYEAPPEVDIVSTSLLVAPNEPDLVSTGLGVNRPAEILVEYTPNAVLEGSIIAGYAPNEVESIEAISASITEVDEVSVSFSPASASVISVSYTTNDTSVPVVEYSCNSVATVEAGRSPAIPSEVSSGYIPYEVDSVITEFTPSTALDIHPGYITYSYSQAVLHDIDNDLVTIASNPSKDRTTGRPALTANNTNGQLRIYVDSEGDAHVLGKMNWGTEYTSWTKILDGVKSVWRVSKNSYLDSYLFLKENSELWAWGDGDSGRLLTSNQSTYTTPIKVQENIKDVYPDGYNTTLALKNDGTLIGAGDNFGGVLDTGTRGWQYTVVQVTTNVKQVHFPYRSDIYILKNDNYIYVNGGVKGPTLLDYSQLHQWRGNIAEIFPDTVRGGSNVTYTYLNNSTHYRFTDYKEVNNVWYWMESASGFSNVRCIEHDLLGQDLAIHTDQDIYYNNRPYAGTASTFNIPYTGGTFGDVKYMILGANSTNNIIVRTDNTYVEVDNLLVKTSESDTNTLLETATLHTFPKYPIEVYNERDPLPVSVVSTSISPNEVDSVDAGAFPAQPLEVSIESTPSSVSVISAVSLPSEVATVEIELNPLKENDLSSDYGLRAFYHFVPEQKYNRPRQFTASDLSTTSIFTHSEYGYLNGRKTVITTPSNNLNNSISTTGIGGITGLERGVINGHNFEACITFLLRNTPVDVNTSIFYARDGGPWDGFSYRLTKTTENELVFMILDSWDDSTEDYLIGRGIYLEEEWNIIQITPGEVYKPRGSPEYLIGNASISINGTTVWTASADDAYPYPNEKTTVRVAMNHIEFAPGIEIGDFIISTSAYSTDLASYPSSLPEDAGYIAHKYSLTHLLPDNHPYKNTPLQGMFYAVPIVNEISVDSSPNSVSTVELELAPLAVKDVKSFPLEFASIEEYTEVYCENVYWLSNGTPWHNYRIPLFVLSCTSHEQRDITTLSNFREPLISTGLASGQYPVYFVEPTYVSDQEVLAYSTFTNPDPGYNSDGTTYLYDIGDVKFSGPYQERLWNNNTEPGTPYYPVDVVRINATIKLASCVPFWEEQIKGNSVSEEITSPTGSQYPLNVYNSTPEVTSYTLGYPEDGTGFGCLWTAEVNFSFLLKNIEGEFNASFTASGQYHGTIMVRVSGRLVPDRDSDADGVADSYDYFYVDPEDTIRKSELDTYNPLTTPLVEWDYIRCNRAPESSDLSKNLIAGEYYLVGDVDNGGWKVFDKHGGQYNPSGQINFIHPDERGDIWDKVGPAPNSVQEVSVVGPMPNPVSSVSFIGPMPNPVSSVSLVGPMPNPVSSVSFVGPMPNPIAEADSRILLIDGVSHETGYSISFDVGQDSTGGTIPLEMIYVNSGTFTMGSPSTEADRNYLYETQHEVTLTKNFYMSKYVITQAQFYEVISGFTYYGNGNRSPSAVAGPDYPVTNVSWFYATAGFAAAMNSKYGHLLPQGWKFELPTEMQWEYACRAGTSTAYNFGDSIDSTKANYREVQASEILPVNHPGHNPNAWGFHQMHGNVKEWCLSRNGENPSEPQTDPLQYGDGSSHRVVRGGSYLDYKDKLRSASKDAAYVTTQQAYIGFRIILTEI